ncbi:hypothetical protein BTO05_02305 [Winogradskyella sp. PC-19]|uniref:HNH endonuclease n=1 Tax=unclassified Winogradskyella TaxID=2615021 RepID=UPI000B3BF38A|nr:MULTISPECIES: HNH endonuclease signature motif containing protein [unclassified Winogradskyella]ARV08530.1 hypothetical protein BTO05_02305 [Winogradskyella sp. PC-19]
MNIIITQIQNQDSDQIIIAILVLVWIIVMTYVFFFTGKSKPTDYKSETEIDVKPYWFYRSFMSRKDYYRNIYLKSDAWQRKRYVVLKRDDWKCVYCGERATQVHHTRYAKYNIGKEPIDWLESVCRPCHEDLH